MSLKVSSPSLSFYLGSWGALVPFVFLVVGVFWIALSGAPDERGFWPILILALSIGLLMAKDRRHYSEAVIDGMSERIVMIMITAWMLASIFGVLMTESGLVQGLTWLANHANLGGRGMVVATFLICCVVSLSTGSSFATILICAPILYPAAGTLGAHLPTLAGAILAGATFGDCIAPISDTTIATATSQEADIGGTVRSRLKYVLPVGALALPAYYLVSSQTVQVDISTTLACNPSGLPMVLAPVLVILLFIRGHHLVHGLLTGLMFGMLLSLALGLLPPTSLLSLDLENFTATSFIIDGINRAVGLSFFTILLMGLVGVLRASGLVDQIVRFASARTHRVVHGEWWIVTCISGAVLLTTHSVVAVLLTGEFAKRTGERIGIHRYRRANLMSLVVCTFPFLFPYFIPVILMANATHLDPQFELAPVSPVDVGLYNFVAWGLLLMVVITVIFGYGRRSVNQDDEAE